MPISVTRIAVSGSSRHTVNGTPISLLRLRSAQIVARMRGAERAEDVLRRRLPGGADDRDDPRAALRADERRERREGGLLIVGDERRRALAQRASPTWSTPVLSATNRSSGADLARVRLDRDDLAARRRAVEPAERECLDLLPGDGDHGVVSAPLADERRQRLARDRTVVEGMDDAGDLLPLLVALAGDEDDVARLRHRDRAPDRRAPVRVDLDVDARALEHVLR